MQALACWSGMGAILLATQQCRRGVCSRAVQMHKDSHRATRAAVLVSPVGTLLPTPCQSNAPFLPPACLPAGCTFYNTTAGRVVRVTAARPQDFREAARLSAEAKALAVQADAAAAEAAALSTQLRDAEAQEATKVAAAQRLAAEAQSARAAAAEARFRWVEAGGH